jgi:hypothetical protein
MTSFHIALFVHLLALFAAFGASTVVHVATVKIRQARSGGEALEWLGLAHAFSPVFPAALAVLVGTGAWMLHRGGSWGAGFVLAGLVGVGLLFVPGAAFEGTRARKLAAALAERPDDPPLDDPLLSLISWANTGIAVGVTYGMVARPSTGAAFAALVAGLVAGAAAGLAAARSRTGETAGRPAPASPPAAR